LVPSPSVAKEDDVANKGHRIMVKLKSTASPYIYYKKKNKQTHPERLELRKYDPVVRKHVTFKESR
jgi:large subunit ribosomal protein L33